MQSPLESSAIYNYSVIKLVCELENFLAMLPRASSNSWFVTPRALDKGLLRTVFACVSLCIRNMSRKHGLSLVL